MRYIDLIEGTTGQVDVTVKGYVGIAATPADSSPFPATFTFEFPLALDRDSISQAIAAKIEEIAGYKPARLAFKWCISKGKKPEL